MVLKPDEQKKLHAITYMILLEFDKICKNFDIPYILIGGTLLGAVRHKGFIPWDDDIDVALLREDYERLQEIMPKALRSEFFWQDWNTEKNYPQNFAKIRVKGTVYAESNMNACENKGIYIDIFPLDNVPESRLSFLLFRIRHTLLRVLIFAKLIGREYRSLSVLHALAGFVSSFFSIDFLRGAQNRVYKNLKSIKTGKVCNIFGSWGMRRETFNKDWIFPLGEAEFETKTFPVPRDCHAFLSHLYGDYMELPPVEKRVSHHKIVELDFGPYTNI